jgi:hypothetical protein
MTIGFAREFFLHAPNCNCGMRNSTAAARRRLQRQEQGREDGSPLRAPGFKNQSELDRISVIRRRIPVDFHSAADFEYSWC